MATARAGDVTFWYEERGTGEPVLFLHGLTWDHSMWDAQVAALSTEYRCLALDLIGHGRTPDVDHEYSFWDLASYVARFLDEIGVPSAHVVGLSMGGMTAMRLALRHPGRVRSLALLDTDAGPEDPAKAAGYHQLAEAVVAQGWEALADQVAAILFGAPFLSRPENRGFVRAKFAANPVESIAYHALRCVTQRDDVRGQLGQIAVPTTVIVGELDVATPPAKAEEIAASIPGARLVRIAAAGHMSPLEAPEAVTAILRDHLAAATAAFAASDGR